MRFTKIQNSELVFPLELVSLSGSHIEAFRSKLRFRNVIIFKETWGSNLITSAEELELKTKLSVAKSHCNHKSWQH